MAGNLFDALPSAAPAPAGNLFDALPGKKGNLFDSLPSAGAGVGGKSPIARTKDPDTGATNPLGTVLDILDRQRQASQALIARGHVSAPLIHGVTPEQQARDREQVRQHADRIPVLGALMTPGALAKEYDDPRLFGQGPGTYGIPVPPAVTQFGRGLTDFGVDTVTDPMSLLGPAEARLAGAAIKDLSRAAGGAVSKVAPEFAKEVGSVGQWIGDQFRFGGAAARQMGPTRAAEATQAGNRQASRQEMATHLLTKRYESIIAPLSEDERRTVYQVLNGERQVTDPASGRLIEAPHVADAAARAQQLLDDAGYLEADASGRRRLAFGKGNLADRSKLSAIVGGVRPSTGHLIGPENGFPAIHPPAVPPAAAEQGPANILQSALEELKSHVDPRDYHAQETGPRAGQLLSDAGRPIEKKPAPRTLKGRVDRQYVPGIGLAEFAAPDAQGILSSSNLRKNYLPAPFKDDPAKALKRPASFNLLSPFAPEKMERESFTVASDDALGPIDEAFRKRLENAARQGTAGKMRDELGVDLGKTVDPNLKDFFEVQPRAKGAARTPAEALADRWRQVVSIPKNTVSTIGLKHGLVNVPTLAAMSEGPGAAAQAIGGGLKMTGLDLPALLERRFGKGMTPEDRFAELRDVVEAGVTAPAHIRDNPIVNALQRAPVIGPTLGKAAAKANELTWAIDDAAKQAVYRRKLERGGDPVQAAADTAREMIDYRNRPAATKAMENVAPFATYKMHLPAAIASSVARNPQRLLAFDRATQGLAGSGKVDAQGRKKPLGLSNPISEALVLGNGPTGAAEYIRSMLADPVKLAAQGGLNAVESLAARKGQPYHSRNELLYGKPGLPYKGTDGKWHIGYAGQSAASYVPFGAGEATLQGAGHVAQGASFGDYPDEDILSLLLGPTLGVR